MEIIRPYGAEDNEINKAMTPILERYIKKQGESIERLEIYGLSVVAYTDKGGEYQMNKAEGCRLGNTYAQSNYFYMTKIENGKRKRIKKQDW